MLNEQEIFDKAVNGVIRQGRLAKAADGTCFYRLERDDGRTFACGIGQLIDDDKFTDKCENQPVSRLIDMEDLKSCAGTYGKALALRTALEGSGVPVRSLERSFLVDIQTAHDQSCGLHDYYIRADSVARKYGLSMANIIRPT